MPPAYTCSVLGTCTASDASTAALFHSLQVELNRVRPLYGLPPDVATDGKIGSKTAAKLIKTAQRIVGTLPANAVDDTIDTYAIAVDSPTGSYGSREVARDAVILLAALRRNGYKVGMAPTQSPPMTMNPYPTTTPGPFLIPKGKGIIDIAVGPTSSGFSPDKLAPPSAPISPSRSKSFKIAAAVVGGVAVVGLLTFGVTALVKK